MEPGARRGCRARGDVSASLLMARCQDFARVDWLLRTLDTGCPSLQSRTDCLHEGLGATAGSSATPGSGLGVVELAN